MDYVLYTGVVCLIVLFLFGMLTGAEESEAPQPHDEPAEETPEIAPDIYVSALAYLLIDAELCAITLAMHRGDDESGKGAKV